MPLWIKRGCLTLLGCLLLPGFVNADVIKCSFTEPFITTSYDTASKRLTVTHDVEKRQEIHDRISKRQLSRRAFELRSADGQVLQRVERTCKGSDGMSDRVYPYSAQWIPLKLYGGCTSTGKTKC
jgi:uncharacterized membrane protein